MDLLALNDKCAGLTAWMAVSTFKKQRVLHDRARHRL
jgi:hypothetical protein